MTGIPGTEGSLIDRTIGIFSAHIQALQNKNLENPDEGENDHWYTYDAMDYPDDNYNPEKSARIKKKGPG